MSDDLLAPYRNKPLNTGWNLFQENDSDTQLDFGIFVMEPGQSQSFAYDAQESAILVLNGNGEVITKKNRAAFDRTSWIEQAPTSVHSPAGEEVTVKASNRTELAIIKTQNSKSFPQKIYLPDEVENEHRGKGMLDDASYRIVRCVFDRRNAPPEANLVLGEVVNFPGRWSSYPPHHHTQPELYYYRFEPDWGYGHGELGEEVFKIKNHDLLRITGERDHSQASAPGFHMYYLWTICHLPDEPYTGFEFTPPFESLLS
ncbi:MAG: 5-deoxy-glucuronate isomerase [Candidatus Hinthialibacter antarcticus]|nr:5-deoxy-glucuronate isomerase [Candidatus Hinthialibacter antarcticus]